MAKTVYIVCHGEYSSFGFDYSWEVREDADAWAKKMGHDVQELTLYGPGESPPLTLLYQGRQRREDIAVRINEQWVEGDGYSAATPGQVIDWPDGNWEVFVAGTDRDRVMKVARDAVAQRRAQDAGL